MVAANIILSLLRIASLWVRIFSTARIVIWQLLVKPVYGPRHTVQNRLCPKTVPTYTHTHTNISSPTYTHVRTCLTGGPAGAVTYTRSLTYPHTHTCTVISRSSTLSLSLTRTHSVRHMWTLALWSPVLTQDSCDSHTPHCLVSSSPDSLRVTSLLLCYPCFPLHSVLPFPPPSSLPNLFFLSKGYSSHFY